MRLIKGDVTNCLPEIQSDSVDSLITDPPAGIGFMGKEWDGDKGGRVEWITWMTGVMRECFRVLKPGAHGLVWAIPRTSHWTATALEDAGFEIRDVVTHLFGTGFPKSLDVSKAIDKAAGVEREVIGHGKAGKSSIGQETRVIQGARPTVRDGSVFDLTSPATAEARQWSGWGTALKPAAEFWILVRKPLAEDTVAANVLKHGTGALNIDSGRIGAHGCGDKLAGMKTGQSGGVGEYRDTGRFPANLVLSHSEGCEPGGCVEGCAVAGLGGASRFFYCAKASKSDRGDANNHPTVKSTELMDYLIRLITAPNGLVLDPFMGSGSTGVAAKAGGFHFVGIEMESNYFDIATKRIADDTPKPLKAPRAKREKKCEDGDSFYI